MFIFNTFFQSIFNDKLIENILLKQKKIDFFVSDLKNSI